MALANVNVAGEALLVSKATAAPDRNPLLLILAVRLPSNVVTFPAVNSPVPPTLRASVPPLLTTIFPLVQLPGVLL